MWKSLGGRIAIGPKEEVIKRKSSMAMKRTSRKENISVVMVGLHVMLIRILIKICSRNEHSYILVEDQNSVSVTYSHPFQFQLPEGLPTSVEGEYGYIRYTIRVNFDEPMWPDNENEAPFTVIKPLNLNDDPTLRVSDKNEFVQLSFKVAIGNLIYGKNLNPYEF